MREIICSLLTWTTACLIGNVSTSAGEPAAAIELPTVWQRGSLLNSRIAIERDKSAHVAFMGGSITEMEGYRPRVMNWLADTYPETKFTFTNAGISSTCSITGAHRLQRDVLSQGDVDLFFVEFAVNDDQDAAHSREEAIRGMEGVIRRIRRERPFADIVMVHFVNPPMLAAIQKGESRISRPAHEAVAAHYNVSRIDVGRELAVRIASETMTWKEYGGTHPKPAGNDFAASLAIELLKKAWSMNLLDPTAAPVRHPLPEQPLDRFSYDRGKLTLPRAETLPEGWHLSEPNWKAIPGSKRTRFLSQSLLWSTTPSKPLTYRFNGRSIGAFVLAGPDAGTVTYTIDGGPEQTLDLSHRFSKGLHYPRTVIFANELERGPHTITLRLADGQEGKAVRMVGFAVNE